MRIKRTFVALGAIALLSGCETGRGLMSDLGMGGGGERLDTRGSSNVQAMWREDVTVSVTGRISLRSTDPNQCHILNVPGEDPYAVVGPLSGIPEGSVVQISGHLASWSTCDTYKTVRIVAVRPAADAS